MKEFMNKEFLLNTETAKTLYFRHAESCPIVDYHNHLSAQDIYERRTYDNLAQVWLEADHYKWRCMRVCGVPETYVTGDASDYTKFVEFSRIMPKLIGSPIYHWTHLELQRYFGITTPLNEKTAKEIWDKTCEMLQGEGFDAVSLLNRVNAKLLCTTDDPADDLAWHVKLASEYETGRIPFRTLPSFRPDRFLNIDQTENWERALAQLSERYDVAVDSWDGLTCALKKSLDFFCSIGCRVTDHGFLRFRYAEGDPAPVMAKAMEGETLTKQEIAVYQGGLLRFLASEYEARGLTMQLHLGPIRNNSPKLFASFGADAGGDSIGEVTDPFQLSALLSGLEEAGHLPKTILYNLNPNDSAMMATMAANFAADGGKVQYGAAWWHLDHIRGIGEQIDQLLETGQISGSVGMLTDSRSFTSFVRHEYYRRILCHKLGSLVEEGQYPGDSDSLELLGSMVEDICWKNAVNYFGFKI
ncbi:MAG: glucuronate isomerase [Firmicutes bacterium]|nr:glucuronate isomerase [Bacillota bacterium]